MSKLEGGNHYDNPEANILKKVDDSLDSDGLNFAKNTEKQKEINIQERIDESFGDLEGKNFKKGDVIKLMFMAENGKKLPCSFNVSNQEINYKGENYKIGLPKGAKLTEVQFTNNNVIMKGKVGWFSGEGKAPFQKLLTSLDQAFSKGSTIIATAEGKEINIDKVS